jgi:BirA family transcriptional regulator, biotin operon repressor / biotin---[acetyl-CoA-carboxylase] ligase
MPLDVERVRRRFPDREILWRDTVDSTMREAARLADAGCASGTVIGADEQTAGRGRYGRLWHSAADEGLYQTVVVRLPIAADRWPVVTLTFGLAVARAIEQTAGVACDLRWPNDVLIGSRKCAGILTELHDMAVVAGIGLNVNQTAFYGELRPIATSLRIATGRLQSREDLLIVLLDEIDRHCDILVRDGAAAILNLFSHASSYVAGRRVEVEQGEGMITGTTMGLTDLGFLRVRRDDGVEETILAGGVRPA